MEKEFVTYEQALALKELKFDEFCFGFYSTSYHGDNIILIQQDVKGANHLVFKDVLAPLKQQVFRWFREKHNLMGIIDGEYNNGKLMFTYVIFCRDIDFDTYEEAESACIDKLIEIAKEFK